MGFFSDVTDAVGSVTKQFEPVASLLGGGVHQHSVPINNNSHRKRWQKTNEVSRKNV